MKNLSWIAALAWALAAPAWAHDHGHAPQHGGIVAEAADVDYELVLQPQAITLYLRDHGKALATEGASGKLTLLLGTQKTELPLSPASDGRLQALHPPALASGAKLLAQVSLPGRKAATVRFVLP